MTQDVRHVPRARLHIVSGKGGTGKTTVASALALALASEGKKVLLCEVEGRQGIASIFDVAPLPYAERRIAVGDGGGEVDALAIDPEAALLEYLQMFYRLGRAGRALDKFGVIDFATTVAPGVRDVLLTGKVYEAAGRKEHGRSVYDAVVLDAPPTGRIGRFLAVNSEVAGIAKVGPIRQQARSIMALLTSSQTRVHLVTTLEEMPVQETLDAAAELSSLGLPFGAVVVNLLQAPELEPDALAQAAAGNLDEARVEASLKEAGIKAEPTVVTSLLELGRQHAERVELETEQRNRLLHVGSGVVTLPNLTDGVDLGGLYELAADLRASAEF
ncbi:MAG: ArsA family ATPase [Propionibacteriales bacterium]|nr:ArsA family ATPase [Propionibacteriales bacterium]